MTNSTRYWLATTSTKLWIVFAAMLCGITYTTTKYYDKRVPTRELDEAIVIKVLQNADKYCKEMKARTYTVRASGLVVDAGCEK